MPINFYNSDTLTLMFHCGCDMTYKQAVSYLYSLEEERINLGLSRINSLLFNLRISPLDLKVIHVAGTNGKGSVAAMMSSILCCAGFKVGVYTSPHLKDFRERIAIKCSRAIYRTGSQRVKYIPKKELIKLVEKIRPIVEKISKTKSGKPTFFEVTTAIMFAYFIKENVDFAVLEVGLGGRLDATNVVLPLVSVITNIGLEHTDRLGNTLEKIAREKCGIIKRGRPVVTAEQTPDILKIIENISNQRKARLFRIGRDVKYKFAGVCSADSRLSGRVREGFDEKKQFFSYSGISRKFKKLPLPLLGKHQVLNACCAIAAIEILESTLHHPLRPLCTLHIIKKGLLSTRWPGRCEVVSRRPYIVLDGAHNPPAASVLARTIKEYFHYEHLILILGILKDKDIDGIMNHLFPVSDSIIFTSPSNSRAVPSLELMKHSSWLNHCTSIFATEDVAQAIELARQIASKDDLILITGSLYTVGDAIKS